ncbi:MazG nucleotide pyrophosphohydrolase domain-containing protein [Streptomyces sp. NPDC055051]
MGAEGARSVRGGKAALEHELADCLWSVIVLSRLYGVDLEDAFLRTMTDLERAIIPKLPEADEATSGPACAEQTDG